MVEVAKKKGNALQRKVDFAKVANRTIADVFGTQPITTPEIMKKVWELIKKEGLQVG